MDETEVLNKLDEILGEEYHPLLCKAKNAIALQRLANRQIRRTIKGNVIIAKEQSKMVSLVNSANYALDGLVKYLVESKGDPLNELLEALRQSSITSEPRIDESK